MFMALIKKIMNYYAVAKGRNVGVYRSWDECKAQVDKFNGAVFKKFSSLREALNFITVRGNSSGYSFYKSRENYQPYRKPSNYYSSFLGSTWHYTRLKSYSQDSNSSTSSKSSVESSHLSSSSSNTSQTADKGYKVNSEGRVEIYTDGACSSNGQQGAKAGLGVYFGDNHPDNVSKAVRGRATNNNAEIQAVTEAARAAKRRGLSKVQINTDSQFLINCATKWMPGWKAKGWQTASKKPVINKEELIEMEEALASLDYKFNYVPGHAGVHGNEMADKLARAGAEK